MPGRASKVVACAAIAGIGGAAFGVGIHRAVQVNDQLKSPANVTYADAAYRQELCFFRAIRSDVPRGAAVYVNGPDTAHTQRLAELSTLWAVPKEFRSAAQWTVTIRYLGKYPPPRRHHRGYTFTRCGGGLLVVRHI